MSSYAIIHTMMYNLLAEIMGTGMLSLPATMAGLGRQEKKA